MDYPAGEDITVEVITEQIPVANSVTVVLRDAVGTVLSNSIAANVAGNLIAVPLDDTLTTLAGTDAEPRFLSIRYTAEGRSYNRSVPLRLVPFMPTLVTPEAVLAFIGLSDDEAPDVNIYNAYKKAVDTVGGISYSDKSDRLILLYAAYDALFLVEMKARQREKSGDAEVDRYKGIDFEALRARIVGEISDLVAELMGADEEVPTLLVLGTPTDPVTGA